MNRPAFAAAQRARVLAAAGDRCFDCGRGPPDVVIHIGHILSVKDGLAAGFTNDELNSDFNLAPMCEEFNLGLGSGSLVFRMAIALFRRNLALLGCPVSTSRCYCGHSFAAHRENGTCVRCGCQLWQEPP